MAIRKLLVANRGEIALRVFRTCRELGIATVAVAAPDDRASLHARSADETVEIAGYLHPEEHVRAARETGADAIHPGYGFLAESGDFADAVQAAGLTWVGPSPDALRLGADKLAAKRLAREAGVPVLPDGPPEEVGFPLLVKAAAGGGGRGMRLVRSPGELADALAAAEREAVAAFGDGTLYCERYLERPRHVEVQLLGDRHGTVVALGERDCSVQRRHQKVLEEAPAPRLDAGLRAELLEAAVAFGRALRYEGAGTVEFVLEDGSFSFLELNGRIQVEHPVTELVTGLDLVAEQLRVAAGEPLTLAPATPHGHAVEVRLYAEDPVTFLPQAGRIERLRLPEGVRVDAGVQEGDEVGLAYDPLIAKLVAHGRDRDEALELLADALAETEVGGVTTNLPFLRWLVAHPRVRAGEATTALLVEHPPLSPAPLRAPAGPWRSPWRLNLPAPPPAPPPALDSGALAQSAHHGSSAVTAPMPGSVLRVEVAPGDEVAARAPLVVLEAMKMEIPVHSPFAGTVAAVHVAPGDRVAGGAVLVDLES
ncbi:MAG TPA: biotin carboxylase N-terminal domain-containing protein [Gaiellaceae bacterium]|nr:biotin carboxylase N-terminal domain-containing protein [Gaiellaceae bacterium]